MAKHRPSKREVIAEKLAVQDAKRDVRRRAMEWMDSTWCLAIGCALVGAIILLRQW